MRRRRSDYRGAEKSCLAAVVIAEWGLRDLETDQDRLTWNRESSTCYRMLVSARLHDSAPTAALELWESYKSAPLRSGHRPAILPPDNFSDLDRMPTLPPIDEVERHRTALTKETVITFALLPDQVVAWVFDDRGIRWHQLPGSADEVERTGDEFTRLCSDPRSELQDLRRNGQRLYDLLILPLAPDLDPSRTLIVETDETIAGIPFAALVDDAGNYLGVRYRLVLSLSFDHMRNLRPSSQVSPMTTALIVGGPALPKSLADALPPLPDAVREAENISLQFTTPLLLTGKQASASTVLRLLPQAELFHFAGHALSSPVHSGLLLAPDNSIGSPESARLGPEKLNPALLRKCQVAVLSACATGKDQYGEIGSAENIARSFLQARVPNVVASLWQIDSASTSNFMNAFYVRLLRGETVSESLRQTARDMREVHATSHPYFWAAFEAFGRS